MIADAAAVVGEVAVLGRAAALAGEPTAHTAGPTIAATAAITTAVRSSTAAATATRYEEHEAKQRRTHASLLPQAACQRHGFWFRAVSCRDRRIFVKQAT